MLDFIRDIPYPILIVATIFMALAPFSPEPHLVEKIRMLSQGTLTKPVDIFDLLWHLLPAALLLTKLFISDK